MALNENLISCYEELLPDDLNTPVELFIVPLIRFNYKQSDYLYLFYKDIIEQQNNQFIIHSTSVWQHWRFAWRSLRKANVILHYHWLECTDLKSMAGIVYKLICIYIFKKSGGKLVWTVHNKMPHDSGYKLLNYKIRSSMANWADLLHVHCKSAVEEISKFYDQPKSKFRIIPHPSYPVTSIPRNQAIEKLNKKRSLNLKQSDQLFLMFGNISSYKQIDKVADMFTELPEHKKLIIVGPVKKGQMKNYREIKERESSQSNIKMLPYFVPEDDVPLYHNACDCVVFNYSRILTSGGFALAKSYHCEVIAPNLGCLSDLNGDNVHLFESQELLFKLLSDFSATSKANA